MTTIIVTEKPDAARRVSEALAESGSLRKHTNRDNVSYYEFVRGGKRHIAICAVGHLFTLDPSGKGKGWSYPVFDFDWKPSFEVRKDADFSRKYFEVVKEMITKGDEYIVATDFDTEGEVIAGNVLNFLANVKDAKRMKFSTLTRDELVESYNTMSPHMFFPMLESGLTRHMLDALWGFNLTRALTLALKNSGGKGFAILSSGRVQSPTLGMLVERELEIRKFSPVPFWQLELHVSVDGKEFVADYSGGRLWKMEEAEKILCESKGTDAIVKDVKKRQYRESPPVPFNTTELQSEAYSQFKYSPTQTLGIAEKLYQAGYISYPRSSSQKLPPSVGYEKILKALAGLPAYKKFAEKILSKGKLVPREGTKEDPAHPCVYATHEVPDFIRLTPQQKNIYDLIARRTLAVFADEALRESTTVMLDVGGNIFDLAGRVTLSPGWIEIYGPYTRMDEQEMPALKVGDSVKVSKLDMLSKQTEPPGRYSQGSILKELEKRNLGTKATRAEILQTLYDRKYISGKSIQVTKLGEAVVDALRENSPRIISEDLTRFFEQEMEHVMSGEKRRDSVVEEAKVTLSEVLGEFKSNEKKIGEKLSAAFQVAREDERTLGACQNCKEGEMKVIFSPLTKKRFTGCSNYFRCARCGLEKAECKCVCGICGGEKGKCKDNWKDKGWEPSCQTSFPLPSAGKIVSTGNGCEVCGWPKMQVFRMGKRPYIMCINHLCKSKENWGKRNGTQAGKEDVSQVSAVARKSYSRNKKENL